ncbi:AAA family ATPase [Kitasatospora sp. NPDC096147]|uniref:helix-turn-helix transcriptional regulator n=1 Tax=Kitasatospora sp. NPDC096147 TaxID=3364093 RepID=UPI003810D8A9
MGSRIVAGTGVPPLVGRAAELAALLDAALSPPAVLTVEGEAGVGRTRLVGELLARPELAGHRLLSGRCRASREQFPYGVVIEALLGAAARLPTAAGHSPLLGVLGRYLPEFAPHLPEPPAPLGDRRGELHRLYRAVRELLGLLGPLVLVVEDLQWADDGSRRLLRFLLDDLPPRTVLVLTHRPEDSPGGLPLGRAYRPAPGCTSLQVRLGPLDVGEVGRLTAALLGRPDVPPVLAARLHARTAGLPLAVVAAVTTAAAPPDGAGRTGPHDTGPHHTGPRDTSPFGSGSYDSGPHGSGPDGIGPGHTGPRADVAVRRLLGSPEVPPVLLEATAERLAALPPAARRITEAAAVLAEPAPAHLLSAVAGLAPAQGRQALSLALERAALVEVADCRYACRHELARLAVYATVPGPRRQELHRRAVAALLGERPEPWSRLAEQSRRAGDPAGFLRYGEAAADHAIGAGDPAAAIDLLQRLLHSPDSTPSPAGRRPRTDPAPGAQVGRSGPWGSGSAGATAPGAGLIPGQESWRAEAPWPGVEPWPTDEARPINEARPTEESGPILDLDAGPGAALDLDRLPAEDLDRLAAKLGAVAYTGVSQREVLALLAALVSGAPLSAPRAAELRLSLGLLLIRQADGLEAARVEIELAVAGLTHRPDLAGLGMAVLAQPYLGACPLDVHLPWLHRVDALIGTTDDHRLRLTLAANNLPSRLHTGDPEAWAAADGLPAEAATPEELRQLARLYCNAADSGAWTGHHRRADSLLRRGLRLAADSRAPYVVSTARATASHLDWLTGRWAGLEQRASRLLAEYRDLLPVASELELVLGLLAAARGAWDRAVLHLTATGVHRPDNAVTPVALAAHAGLVGLLLAQDADGPAAEEAARGLRLLRAKGVWAWAGELAPVAVEALCRVGRTGEALRLLAELDAHTAELSAPLARAALAHGRGVVAAHEGDQTTAVRCFDRARELYGRLPAPYPATLAAERSARCGLALGDPGAAAAIGELADVFLALGAPRDAARCRHAYRATGAPTPSRRGRRGYGDRLSPREHDVARLLADGHTNREIAEVLFLSVRTVEQHVVNVLRKLRVGSRAEVTAVPEPSADRA